MKQSAENEKPCRSGLRGPCSSDATLGSIEDGTGAIWLIGIAPSPCRSHPTTSVGALTHLISRWSSAIRIVDCGTHYMAIEGSHRLAAAADLKIVPPLIVLAEHDLVDQRTTDIGELFDPGMNIVTACEIVGKCQSDFNPVFIINPDCTLTSVAARQEED